MDELAVTTLIAEVDDLLAERARHFPHRLPVNTAALNTAYGRLFTLLWADTQASQTSPADCQTNQFADDPIFLCGYLKSGTTLLTGLLDNHPALVTLPGDTNTFPLLARFRSLPRPELERQWAAYWLKRFVNPPGQPPFCMLGLDGRAYANLLRWFRFWLARWDGQDAAFLLQTAVFAYFCANQERPSALRYWAAKTPRDERNVAELRRLFPQARFIHILRDPRQNLASLKKLHQHRGWRWRPFRTALSLWRSVWLGWRNRRRLGQENYLILRYESLLADPHSVTRRIADFLDIPWQPTLLTPTANGRPLQANSMYKEKRVTGRILPAPSPHWAAQLNRRERLIGQGLLAPLLWLEQTL
ncbi:MAG: sulfotransferase [Anaerolineae bacterium]